MAIITPGAGKQFYSKQLLHPDELPFFAPWEDELILNINGTRIAPAICYESLQPEHSGMAHNNNAAIYMASVAKSAEGIDKDYEHFPEVAAKYSMTVMMCNSVGECDNFISTGNSAVWNNEGNLTGSLDDVSEGLLIYDLSNSDIKTLDLG